MRSMDFFDTHPVFRHAEFLAARAGRSRRTSDNLLARHLAAGRLVRVRRGLYATVPRGVDPARMPVDPYLVASRVTVDAVVAYHGALQFHGKAHSLWRRFDYLSRTLARPFVFQDQQFVPVQPPRLGRSLPDWGGGVVEVPHANGVARVTTLERALVDVLHAPDRGGGWEEIWRSLETVEFVDLQTVTEYALQLGSALTIARVGFYLDQHREALMVEERHLERLRLHAPAQPRYLDNARSPGRLVPGWRLIVPESVLRRGWEEPG